MRYWVAFACVWAGGVVYAVLHPIGWWHLLGAAVFGVLIAVGFEILRGGDQ